MRPQKLLVAQAELISTVSMHVLWVTRVADNGCRVLLHFDAWRKFQDVSISRADTRTVLVFQPFCVVCCHQLSVLTIVMASTRGNATKQALASIGTRSRSYLHKCPMTSTLPSCFIYSTGPLRNVTLKRDISNPPRCKSFHAVANSLSVVVCWTSELSKNLRTEVTRIISEIDISPVLVELSFVSR